MKRRLVPIQFPQNLVKMRSLLNLRPAPIAEELYRPSAGLVDRGTVLSPEGGFAASHDRCSPSCISVGLSAAAYGFTPTSRFRQHSTGISLAGGTQQAAQ
jgi:hypothetical protein